MTARNAPKAFGFVYRLGGIYRVLPFRSPVYFANRIMNNSLRKYIEQNQFDVVIMTHIFPAEILTNMKRHGIRVPKMVFVATDYTCYPFTEEIECDAYVISSGDLSKKFENIGVSREKIYPFGIPTDSKFNINITRDDAIEKLGLDKNKKYILITGGSMGGGKIEKTIAKIRSHFENRDDIGIIVVCGSNKVMFNKLNESNDPKITVVGYTDDMPSYIRASSLFITKPGGLSSTEAAVCGVPILHTSQIPGCESDNAKFFSEHGMSIYGEMNERMMNYIETILTEEAVSSAMVACQKRYVDPYSAEKICDLSESISEQKTMFVNC